MSHLNWRRVFLLTKAGSFDSEDEFQYIQLDRKKIPEKLSSFCEAKSFELGFDYDPYSYLLWSIDDSMDIHSLANLLNEQHADCAKVVTSTLGRAHGLDLTDTDEPEDGSDLAIF